MTRRFAVNVDVDGLHHYHAIHAIAGEASEAAWEIAVPRLLEVFGEHGLAATFFVVGDDLSRRGPRRVAASAVARGHELASHSQSHFYDLVRRSPGEIEDEVARAEAPLSELRGSPVSGFRAPGYNLSSEVLRVLAARGYLYDSSLFPCPAYFAARALVIAGMAMRGQRSRSIVGDPWAPFGPRLPHRLASGLLEIPVTVLPVVRAPVIGTSLTLLGRAGVAALAPILRRMSFVNLELHAIDALDASDPVTAELARAQPDLRVPWSRKRALLETVLRACSGAENATLEAFSRDNQLGARGS